MTALQVLTHALDSRVNRTMYQRRDKPYLSKNYFQL